MNATANPARRRGLTIVFVVVAVAALVWLGHWWWVSRFAESTDDAYVAGRVVQITPQVAGTVVAIHAEDTQQVRSGDVLVEFDPSDAKVALDQAEADLARAVREVRTLFTRESSLRAQIAQRQTDLERVRADLKRRQSLSADGAVSGEELSHARDAVASVEQTLTVARSELEGLHAQISGTSVDDHPNVQRAAARVRELDLALMRTRVIAPVGGVVAKRGVQLGQRMSPGTPMMAVVPLDDVWVDANFKEVQLARMRAGQPVSLHADLYGSDVVFHGTVRGLSAGTGAAFSVLPAQNASGNWIKVVQRVPVRIALDPKELAEHPLRVGLSMSARVDVTDSSGRALTTTTRGDFDSVQMPLPTSDVEARIARIIAANDGSA